MYALGGLSFFMFLRTDPQCARARGWTLNSLSIIFLVNNDCKYILSVWTAYKRMNFPRPEQFMEKQIFFLYVQLIFYSRLVNNFKYETL